MNAHALRTRILSALALGYPLSSPDLQRMLCASENGVWTALRNLRASGQVQAKGRPYRYELKTLSTTETS